MKKYLKPDLLEDCFDNGKIDARKCKGCTDLTECDECERKLCI